MSLETRIKNLESRTAERIMHVDLLQLSDAEILQLSDAEMRAIIERARFDLALLTDAELMSLDIWLSRAEIDAPLPPELEAALARVAR
jgi:uncharacterized coiled-coil protein SlyX